MKREMMVFGAVAALAAAACGGAIPIDFSQTCGPVKPVNGVGQPPILGWDHFGLFKYLKEAGIPYSRLHDVGGAYGMDVFVDIPNLFRDFDADENDPANYDFAFTDLLLKALVANGVEPYFRLGVTIENAHYVKPYRVFPPKDYAKWARVCEHVIRHYTEGWANGCRMKISHWEIWNEPENAEKIAHNQMWKAPFSEYVKLYVVAAKHLKAKFPHLKIGGYGSCGLYAVSSSWAKPGNARAKYLQDCFTNFVAEVKRTGAPLDFFSFHCYDRPPHLAAQCDYVRRTLDAAGFAQTEMSLNEWLPLAQFSKKGTAQQASEIAAMLAIMQNGPVDDAEIYDARVSGDTYAPLFNAETREPRKAYYVYLAFNELRKLGKAVKMPATPDGIHATAATDGGANAAVMVANISGRPWRTAALDFGGWEVAETRAIDARRTYAVAAWPVEIPSSTVWLLKLRRSRGARPAAWPGFTRGMGFGGWLTNYKRFNVLPENRRLPITEGDLEHFDTYLTEADVARVASWGFDHVRVGFDQIVLEERPGVWRERTFRRLDAFVDWCARHGLNVVLNLHKAVGNYCDIPEKVQLLDDPALQARFIALWLEIERRYHAKPGLAFEILNEVRDVDPAKWNALADKTVRALRAKNPDRWIVVGSTRWNSSDTLAKLKVWDDPRIVYTFHMYEPFAFTHQRGVLQSGPLGYNRALAYPAKDNARYRGYYTFYGWKAPFKDGEAIDRAYLGRLMAGVGAFVKAHPDKILWNGEFGTIRHADPASRAAYMRDVISICREHGVPWCVWNYLSTPNDGNRFSLVDDDTREFLSDDLLKACLGL